MLEQTSHSDSKKSQRFAGRTARGLAFAFLLGAAACSPGTDADVAAPESTTVPAALPFEASESTDPVDNEIVVDEVVPSAEPTISTPATTDAAEPADPDSASNDSTAPSTTVAESSSPATSDVASTDATTTDATTNDATASSAPTGQSPTTAPAAPTTTAVSPTTTPAAPIVANPTSSYQGSLFVDPNNSAAQWATNNSADGRASVIANDIGNKPIAKWFGEWNPNISADVASYVQQASDADAVPMLVAYNVPDRDCGQHSAGGAATYGAYEDWIDQFSSGLGNSSAIIILEPDALALNSCAGSDRNAAIANAVVTIKNSCSGCSVYLDAGHSSWVPPTEMAARLVDAGVLHSDGFFTNVSNYNATSSEEAFGRDVLAALGNPTGLGQVVDVSRNGNGANGEWCDPGGRAVGTDPVLNPSNGVHAHLWVKVPGEADGCIGAAGQFVPDRAYELATG